MTTFPHESPTVREEKERWAERLFVHEMWASLAIVVMWLAVLFDAIYGPNIVAETGAGSTSTTTTVPSAIVVAFFAFLATWVVARYGLDHRRKE